MNDERIDRLMYYIAVALGIALAIVGLAGANTHLAPDRCTPQRPDYQDCVVNDLAEVGKAE